MKKYYIPWSATNSTLILSLSGDYIEAYIANAIFFSSCYIRIATAEVLKMDFTLLSQSNFVYSQKHI